METGGRVVGAGEVRRVHVVYFLSHGGQTEQPHFFRVRHACRAGVFLRDIKRWLAELRGKDMPDAFAWSYKRKYRTGYIWQDLVDDDLLTPISDNEYVILGSAKLASSFYDSSASEASPMKKKQSTKAPQLEEEEEEEEADSPDLQSPQSSILTDDDSMKLELQQEEEGEEEEEEEEKPSSSSLDSSSFRFGLLSKKKKKNNKVVELERYSRSNSTSTIVLPVTTAAAAAAASGTFTWPSAGNTQFPKRKSYSGGPSHVFRNLITCGAVDTKDAILVVMSRPGSRTESPTAKYGHHQQDAARKSSSRPKTWNDKNERQRDYSTQKPVPAAYKPTSRPNCSQCGKPFKPEKMHKHMRSCPGMKSTTVTRKTSLPEKECSRKPMDGPVFHQPSSSILTYTHRLI